MNAWADWIGKTTSTSNFLDVTQVQKLEATLGRTPQLTTGAEVPPAWHWLYFHELATADQIGSDGHTMLGITMPPFPLPRRMWAGGLIEWHQPLLLGAAATKESKIIDIKEKTGRTGDLIFTTVEHKVHQDGDLCIREEHNIVYREPVGQSSNLPQEVAPTDSDFRATWQPNEVMLFRYSALTFNGHRIHYDADYTRDVEGYSGLIVHGPLLATLMLDLAKANNRPFNRFEYRAKSPVTVPMKIFVHGKVDGDKTSLWISNDQGGLVMQGELS